MSLKKRCISLMDVKRDNSGGMDGWSPESSKSDTERTTNSPRWLQGDPSNRIPDVLDTPMNVPSSPNMPK